MLPRLLKLPQNQSFFLFGARNTGKSTLLRQTFTEDRCFWIDLLDPSEEDRFSRTPQELTALVLALPETTTHVIIDEIQKIPKLLDVIHSLIEKTDKKFVLTGSSARKLKYGGANLLAGRAFVYHLFPFSFLELGIDFNQEAALRWGLLPSIPFFQTENEKLQFLQAYALTYLKEEIWAEQLIKNLDPFRRFLEVAAQTNGKIINFANVSRDVGVDDKTVKEYFTILEDTLIGFFLESYQHSFRKRLSLKPKFYLFDTGVTRALARQLTLPLKPQTSLYGETFEHMVILECQKLKYYFQPEFRFSYLQTKDDVEVDLVVERPGQPLLFIEIKSNESINEKDLSKFANLVKDFPDCEAICFSNDKQAKKIGIVSIYPWREGIKKYFLPQTI